MSETLDHFKDRFTYFLPSCLVAASDQSIDLVALSCPFYLACTPDVLFLLFQY